MLEVQKQAICDLSNDKTLFRKEIIKALVWIKTSEKKEFKSWLLQNFGSTHQLLINQVFEVIK